MVLVNGPRLLWHLYPQVLPPRQAQTGRLEVITPLCSHSRRFLLQHLPNRLQLQIPLQYQHLRQLRGPVNLLNPQDVHRRSRLFAPTVADVPEVARHLDLW